MTKPIRIWLSPPGPNPWKVVLIAEELNIPYEIIPCKFENVKKRPFTDLNPNGRYPAIVDPNTGLTLWESGAIIQYFIEQYDVAKSLTYESLTERHYLNQWLMFQMSGQGPYFGQAGWFNVLHSEKIPSAIERYTNEVRRVLGVLDSCLQDKSWLVGNKCTYADLAFVPWNDRVDTVLMVEEEKRFDGFPNVKAWHERMISRPSWQKVMQTRTKMMQAEGLQWNGMPEGVDTIEEYLEKIRQDESGTA